MFLYAKEHGLTSEDLPYEERALLFAFAFSWHADIPDHESTTSIEQKSKVDMLEKNTWLFKMNAEVRRMELVSNAFFGY